MPSRVVRLTPEDIYGPRLPDGTLPVCDPRAHDALVRQRVGDALRAAGFDTWADVHVEQEGDVRVYTQSVSKAKIPVPYGVINRHVAQDLGCHCEEELRGSRLSDATGAQGEQTQEDVR